MKYQLSVIIPIYNVEKYLDECLKSIIPLIQFDIEIICINDGSNDNSLSILNRYRKLLNLKIINQNNKGLSATRNIGIKEAAGEYLAFIDSDDYVNANALIELLYSAKDNDVDIAVGDYWEFKENEIDSSCLRKSVPAIINEPYDGKKFITNHYKPLGSVIWRNIYRKKFIIDNNLWFHEGVYFEDVEYTLLTFSRASRVLYTSIPFYFYRKRIDSITTSSASEKKVKDTIIIWQTLIGESNKISDKRLSSIFRELGFHCFLSQYTLLNNPIPKETLTKVKNLSSIQTNSAKYFLVSLLFRFLPDSLFFFLLKVLK